MPIPSPRPFRKKANWLVSVGVELLAPLLRGWARLKTGPPGPRDQWRRALIIGDNHIGDLLYRSASLEHLKAGFPNCDFYYLAAPGSAAVIEGNPAIARILPWLHTDSPLDLAPEDFAALKAMQFDAALCTNCTKYWPELLLALRLGIPNRVGYIYKGFSGWVTDPMPIRCFQPFPAYFREYVAALTNQKATWPLRPVIFTNEQDQAEADALWNELQLDRYPGVTVSFMTSRQPTGVWPAARFAESLAALRRKTDSHILLCGSAEDKGILQRVNDEFNLQADIIAGRLGIRALCCFLRGCSVVFTTDSGPRHIANAAGARVVFVRNAWFNAAEAGSYVDTEIDLCEKPLPRAEATFLEALFSNAADRCGGPDEEGASCGEPGDNRLEDNISLLEKIAPETAADVIADIDRRSHCR